MEESTYLLDAVYVGVTIVLVLLNGFFVAAEFAMVKLSKSKISSMQKEGRAFASTAMWLFERQNLTLSACQLGITMASLALGWIGEPALADLMEPMFISIGLSSPAVMHTVSFIIAFSIITFLHIIIGEQVPKIYAIRKPENVFLWCALPLKMFYIILYPFMVVLDNASNMVLRKVGITDADGHETVLSEEEIRASLSIAHAKGELSKNEHQLLNAVFKFDDQVARQIMVSRGEVEFLDMEKAFKENLKVAMDSKHTRFPLCKGSLDEIIGVVHMKDLLGVDPSSDFSLREIARKPMYVPKNILISRLLQEFRLEKQHFAFVEEEHGTMLGIVTMENVLEQLVGQVQDEFDAETPSIVSEGKGAYLVEGDALLDDINEKLRLYLQAEDADTISGLLVEKAGHKLEKGNKISLMKEVDCEVLEVDGIRAKKVRLQVSKGAEDKK